jgi:hypothetical protein
VEANDSPPYRHWHVVCAACGKIALARPCAPRREIKPVEHNPLVKCHHCEDTRQYLTNDCFLAASVADKLNRYLLNPDNSVGKTKADWFRRALGFTRDNAAQLANQIAFKADEAWQTAVTQYGTKYNQIIQIVGANGKTIPVTVGWIIDGEPRLVTAIPTKGN